MPKYRNLTDGELKEPEWWCNHHKESIKWLVTRIHDYFTREGESKEQVATIIKACLPAFAEGVGVELDETKRS